MPLVKMEVVKDDFEDAYIINNLQSVDFTKNSFNFSCYNKQYNININQIYSQVSTFGRIKDL